MAGKKKFEPEKVSAALRLLRALPVKDNRKTISETLMMLKGGILEALDKGYDRMEIRRTIAAAEVVISATTFNDFLAGNLNATQESGNETASKRKKGGGKTATEQDATAKAQPAETETVAVEKQESATPENGNGETEKRESESMETATELEATAKAVSAEAPSSPGSIIIKPDTPKEEL